MSERGCLGQQRSMKRDQGIGRAKNWLNRETENWWGWQVLARLITNPCKKNEVNEFLHFYCIEPGRAAKLTFTVR